MQMPHTEQQQQRERALLALGGDTAGCFAARRAWRTGTNRPLPRAFRDLREELFARVHHGDTPGVLRLLDAGIDPHARDPRHRTLMHKLPLLDYEVLLPRLLKAGLDVNAVDGEDRSPLFVAICEDGPVDLVRALLDAGARLDLSGKIHDEPMTLYRLIDWKYRDDLGFLTELIESEYPHLTEED